MILNTDFFDRFPDVVLDGELYNHELKNDFEKIISLVRKTKPTDEDRLESAEKVQFHCYDTIMEHMDFQGRHKFIRDSFGRSSRTYPYPSVRSLMAATVYNTEEVEAYHEGFLEEKYEGSILEYEVKSINSKFLDLNIKSNLDSIIPEKEIRKLVKDKIERG